MGCHSSQVVELKVISLPLGLAGQGARESCGRNKERRGLRGSHRPHLKSAVL